MKRFIVIHMTYKQCLQIKIQDFTTAFNLLLFSTESQTGTGTKHALPISCKDTREQEKDQEQEQEKEKEQITQIAGQR